MITSKDNKWLRLIREVRRGKVASYWLLEGLKTVLEALELGSQPVVILVDPDRHSDSQLQLLAKLAPNRLLPTSGIRLDEVADQDSPRGLVALFPRSPGDREKPPALPGLYIFADRIQDPGNLGALIRVGLAFGVRAIFVSPGSCSLAHPRVVRASAGLVIRAPVFEREILGSTLSYLRAQSPLIVALDAKATSRLDEVHLPATVLLMVGTEGQGLASDLREASSLALSIPICQEVESLNLATAAAVACYEFTRQQAARAAS